MNMTTGNLTVPKLTGNPANRSQQKFNLGGGIDFSAGTSQAKAQSKPTKNFIAMNKTNLISQSKKLNQTQVMSAEDLNPGSQTQRVPLGQSGLTPR